VLDRNHFQYFCPLLPTQIVLHCFATEFYPPPALHFFQGAEKLHTAQIQRLLRAENQTHSSLLAKVKTTATFANDLHTKVSQVQHRTVDLQFTEE